MNGFVHRRLFDLWYLNSRPLKSRLWRIQCGTEREAPFPGEKCRSFWPALPCRGPFHLLFLKRFDFVEDEAAFHLLCDIAGDRGRNFLPFLVNGPIKETRMSEDKLQ